MLFGCGKGVTFIFFISKENVGEGNHMGKKLISNFFLAEKKLIIFLPFDFSLFLGGGGEGVVILFGFLIYFFD